MHTNLYNYIITFILFTGLTSFQCMHTTTNEYSHDIIVSVKLMGMQNHDGDKKYSEIGRIDEYDENGSANPIPDTIDVRLNIDLNSYYQKHDFLKGDNVVKDFYINVSVKLVFSESNDCINMLNPQVIEFENIITNERINYTDFFKKEKYVSVTKTAPLLIKKLVEFNKNKKLFLSQFKIITRVKSVNGTEDIIEYNKPICN
jgi:hypothetical protein